MSENLLIHNITLVDRDTEEKGAVLVSEGKIEAVFKGDFSKAETALTVAESYLSSNFKKVTPSQKPVLLDGNGLTLMPAFIDTHVHLRDPGFTYKEDLESGLAACAHGGYGTVVAMPNTNPVISSKEQAREVMERGNALGKTKLFQSISITKDFKGTDISHLDGLSSVEFPLITEDGHDVENTSLMLEGMKKASENGQIVSCHCEDCTLALAAKPHRVNALSVMKEVGLSAWGSGDISSVPEAKLKIIDEELTEANSILSLEENTPTERNIRLAQKANCHIHICHISTKEAVDAVRRAKMELLETGKIRSVSENLEERKSFFVTAEATPHHIALTGDREPLIRALVNPPLRAEDDRRSVIEALRLGVIDCIATDHAPHSSEDKEKGAPGFTGIEVAYGVVNTVLVKEEGFSKSRLSALMSANPARILNLKKGLLKCGYDADLVLCDPDEKWTVSSKDFISKGKATPFEGRELFGKVKKLILNGNVL